MPNGVFIADKALDKHRQCGWSVWLVYDWWWLTFPIVCLPMIWCPFLGMWTVSIPAQMGSDRKPYHFKIAALFLIFIYVMACAVSGLVWCCQLVVSHRNPTCHMSSRPCDTARQQSWEASSVVLAVALASAKGVDDVRDWGSTAAPEHAFHQAEVPGSTGCCYICYICY